jgi:hypothetical protein
VISLQGGNFGFLRHPSSHVDAATLRTAAMRGVTGFLGHLPQENDNNIPGPWDLGRHMVAILKQVEARKAQAEKVGRGCIRPSPGPQGKM